jgi:hypothetical protein
MKGFYIQVKNDLLDPKHFHAMGESIWLFLWCLDHMTSITEQGVGKVLGGKPIKYGELKTELDVTERSFRRWVATLKKNGYINTVRTPYGLVMTVNKASKKFKKRDVPKVAYQSGRDMPKSERDMPKPAFRYANLAQTKKTLHDNTKDRVFSENGEELKPLPKDDFLKRLRGKIAAGK